jgi:hypothetical protein
MDLSEIISISGKPGLFKVVGKTKTGVVVESLDEKKSRMSISANHQMASLDDITIYAEGDENLILKNVFEKMKEQEEESPPVQVTEDPVKLREYFNKVATEHDQERVYISDIKKVIKWYNILIINKIIK